jgi:hypothetical protein
VAVFAFSHIDLKIDVADQKWELATGLRCYVGRMPTRNPATVADRDLYLLAVKTGHWHVPRGHAIHRLDSAVLIGLRGIGVYLMGMRFIGGTAQKVGTNELDNGRVGHSDSFNISIKYRAIG